MKEKVKGIQLEANQSTAKHHKKKDLRCQSAGNTWQDWHACQKWVDACFPDTPEDGSEENLASIEAGYLIVEGEHYEEHGPGCSCRPPPDSAEEAHFWGNDDAVLCCGRGCLRERSYYTLHNLTMIIDPQGEGGSADGLHLSLPPAIDQQEQQVGQDEEVDGQIQDLIEVEGDFLKPDMGDVDAMEDYFMAKILDTQGEFAFTQERGDINENTERESADGKNYRPNESKPTAEDEQEEQETIEAMAQAIKEHEQAAVDGKSLDMSKWRFALSNLSSSTRAEVQVWANSLGCRGIHSEVLPLT